MMVSKVITLLSQIIILNEYIREWRHHSTDQKTWSKFKIFFHQAHREKIKVVKTAGKGGYTAAVKNIYGVPPTPPE